LKAYLTLITALETLAGIRMPSRIVDALEEEITLGEHPRGITIALFAVLTRSPESSFSWRERFVASGPLGLIQTDE